MAADRVGFNLLVKILKAKAWPTPEDRAILPLFARYMNDPDFQKTVSGWLANEVYQKLRGEPLPIKKYSKIK
jgi:hypothetical protein